MSASIGEFPGSETAERREIDRLERDRTVLKLMHSVRLWLGRALS